MKDRLFDWFLYGVFGLAVLLVVGAIAGGIWYIAAPKRTVEARVAEKYYRPEWDEYIGPKHHESCTGTGKSRSCTEWWEPARRVHHSETFQVKAVEIGCPDIYTWDYVTKDAYAGIKVGDDWAFKTVWARCKVEAK